MNQKSENKKATDSMTESSKIVQSKDINGQNRLFGGRLMEWIRGRRADSNAALRRFGYDLRR